MSREEIKCLAISMFYARILVYFRIIHLLRSDDRSRICCLRLLRNRRDVVTIVVARSPNFRAHKSPHGEAADQPRQGKEYNSEYGYPAILRTQTIRSLIG